MSHKLFRNFPAPPFVYHPAYSCPWPVSHRFPMMKFKLLSDILVRGGIFNGQFETPVHPFEHAHGLDDVYLAHDRNYIDRFCKNELSSDERKRINLDFNEHLVYRTFAETGGTMHASDLALQYGLAVNCAGGTHHAHYSYGSGFTILNDLAITALRLLHRTTCQSILIFDCDVHQGDGTATICSSEKRIHTVSMHCQDNFPFTKATSTWDIPLAVGMQDEEYLATLQSTLFESLRVYRPDFVLYDAGVDISQHDVLGKLKVSDDGIFQRDYFVLKTCFEKGIPVCAVIGGGYDASLPRLVARHSLLFRAAIKVWNHE